MYILIQAPKFIYVMCEKIIKKTEGMINTRIMRTITLRGNNEPGVLVRFTGLHGTGCCLFSQLSNSFMGVGFIYDLFHFKI